MDITDLYVTVIYERRNPTWENMSEWRFLAYRPSKKSAEDYLLYEKEAHIENYYEREQRIQKHYKIEQVPLFEAMNELQRINEDLEYKVTVLENK